MTNDHSLDMHFFPWWWCVCSRMELMLGPAQPKTAALSRDGKGGVERREGFSGKAYQSLRVMALSREVLAQLLLSWLKRK